MMAEFWRKSYVVAVLILGLNNQINLVRAAKCDLENIFRTPRDMSKVNFDHFEIVERGYDAEPTTTTTEAPISTEPTTKKNGDTIAKAQVLLRFGGDDIYGSNHIMKIPPQCRNVASHVLPHYPNPYYQPPYHPSYYHPYPPPVPYTFPNYYFCNYAQASQNLPRPLQEYFRQHGQFSGGGEGFITGHPAGEDGHHTDFVDVNHQSKNLPGKSLANATKMKQLAAALFIRPRTPEPLDLIDEDIEEAIMENTKIDAYAEKEAKNQKNATMENNHIMDFSEKSEKHHKHERKDKINENDELKTWLRKALVAYQKCPDCTESPKILASYPITNQECQPILSSDGNPFKDKKSEKFSNHMHKVGALNTEDAKDDCKCLQCQCSKKYKKRNNMDDLDIIVADIIDPYDTLLKTSEKDQKSLIYNLANIGLHLADLDDSSGLQQVPPKISLDLELVNNKAACAGSSPFVKSCSSNYRYPKPKNSNCGHSISAGFRHSSNPCAVTYYQVPTNIETLDADMGYKSYDIPLSDYGARNPSTNYCRSCNGYISPSVYHNYHSHPKASPDRCYFFPEPNVYINKQPAPHIPKLIEVVPRPNPEILPNYFCTKCGHKHSGNNFCDNCGHRIAF